MRIAFVSLMAGSPWAASEVLWAETAELALAQGHDVLVSTLGWRDRPPAIVELERHGARLNSRPLSRWYRRSSLLTQLTGSFAALRAFKPDVICISQGGTYDIARSGASAILRRMLKRFGAPYVLLCHCEQPAPPERNLRRARKVFDQATVVGMVASRLQTISENHLGGPIANVRVFHNPVNLRRIEYLPWPAPSTPIRFASVGRLDPVKNIGSLIEALSKAPWRERDWMLTVYGAGPERPILEQQVRQKQLGDRIVFAGYVDDIAAVWATHHVLIMPSRFEGVPLAMIEAMLCGRPVVATDIGGIAEWIDEGHNGFLIANPTPADIGTTMERLWSYRYKLEELGRTAHERTLAKRDSNPARTLLDWIEMAASTSHEPLTRSLALNAGGAGTSASHSIEFKPPTRRPGVAHPRISVVIPTYEPERFLTDAVKSVLSQDLGAEELQIAIVDDGSTKVRTAEIVEAIAPRGRIEIYEHGDNLGLAGNWNRAISLARGDYIHVLHQDDVVCPGFYAQLAAGLASSPRVGMAFCRHAYTDENDMIDRISHRERWRAGVLTNWLERIAETQRIQCPAAIVKRDVYERLGGFRSELRYALDWEMWVRIAARYDVWYEPAVLAHYRRHRSAESARLEASGRINVDLMNAIELFSSYLPVVDRARLKDRAYRRLARLQLRRATKLLEGRFPQRAADQVHCARAALERLPEDLAKRWARGKLVRLEAQLASHSLQSPR
jgi:glycosyltransferase involved in cell wall biosynthesis